MAYKSRVKKFIDLHSSNADVRCITSNILWKAPDSRRLVSLAFMILYQACARIQRKIGSGKALGRLRVTSLGFRVGLGDRWAEVEGQKYEKHVFVFRPPEDSGDSDGPEVKLGTYSLLK